MSPYGYAYATVFVVYNVGHLDWLYVDGSLNDGTINNTVGVRPVINLRADVQITGSGTTSDPYTIVGI